jgi:glycerophosphoryl diester phosphodiesterase
VNNEEDFLKALDLGIDGIITDYPTRLVNFIKTNPKYSHFSID